MKRILTADDAMAGIWGGAILGGGGGGHIETALRAVPRIFDAGTPELWGVDELSDDALTATVSLVGSPSNASEGVSPEDSARSFELLQAGLRKEQTIVAVNSNENGAETTINGWLYSAATGLPVLDLACNGRAHPTSLMGSMGLHLEPGYVSIQGFSGGRNECHVEGLVRGSIERASSMVRYASTQARGFVAVSRNPCSIGYARRNGAPGSISAAIEVGEKYLDGGVAAVLSHMDGRLVAEGTVIDFECTQKEGLDVGHVRLDDTNGTTLHFVNEYLLLEQEGRNVASFPDLITTFGNGRPVISAHVPVGTRIRVMVVGRERLLLSGTMGMSDLYKPLHALLGRPVSP